MFDRFWCMIIRLLGEYRETYLGKNSEGYHLFYRYKTFMGFPDSYGTTIKYRSMSSVSTAYGKITYGYNEVQNEK